MTDDLVKRLRDVAGVIIGAQSQNLEEDYELAREAADRLEQLESSSKGWKEIADEYFDAIGERNTRIEKLEEVLLGIKIYGNDTMSGPADGSEDNRNWYRGAVIVMKNRAREALGGKND